MLDKNPYWVFLYASSSHQFGPYSTSVFFLIMQSSYSGQQASRYPDASTANIEGLASKIGAHTSYIPDILCRQKPNLKSNPHQFHHVGGAAIRSGSRGPSTASTRPSGNGQPAERPKSADYRRLLLAELNQELISASTSELKEVINYLRNRGRSIIHSSKYTKTALSWRESNRLLRRNDRLL